MFSKLVVVGINDVPYLQPGIYIFFIYPFIYDLGMLPKCFLRFLLVLFSVLKISRASFCPSRHQSSWKAAGWHKTKSQLPPSPRCDEQNFCAVNANLDELDEDPCPKTEKYLEAHFVCHSLIDGPPPVQGWSNVLVCSPSWTQISIWWHLGTQMSPLGSNLCPATN